MTLLPPFAYVPGQTGRHPEGAFDAIRNTALAGMSADDLATSEAFVEGLRYLREGFFWEAHEVLEPVWMALPPNAIARAVLQGLIQLANARLKVAMGKPNAARRLYQMAQKHLSEANGGKVMGLETAVVIAEIDSELKLILAL